MFEADDLTNVVFNILSGNRFSHCRLCLKGLSKHYVKLEDMVKTDVNKTFRSLSVVLTELLGRQVCSKAPGIEAVCTECTQKAVEALKFIHACRTITGLLNNVVNGLCHSINADLRNVNADHSVCVVVNKDISKVVTVTNEWRKRNVEEQSFDCFPCNEYFSYGKDLKDHNTTCHSTMTCDDCYETFTTESELNFHMSSHQKYKCPHCDTWKYSRASLKQHLNEIHEMHICSECGKSLLGQKNLEKHQAKQCTKSECPKCGKTYVTKDFFLKHVKSCLEGVIDPHPVQSDMEKPFVCEKCGKGYSTNGGLRVHHRFQHDNEKPHICKQCGKKFTAPSYLKIHMIKHTGEKNFECELCGNRLVSKEALLYHTRRHTGEKPYSCKLCDEKFVNASARAEHVKFKHISPKYKCDICKRMFFTRNFLKQHMSRHYDPTSKLYCGRNLIPPHVPGEQNMRIRTYS